MASTRVVAVLSSVLSALCYLYRLHDGLGPQHVAQFGMQKCLYVFAVAMIAWLSTMSIPGGPIWALLHLTGRRQAVYADVAGFLIPFIVVFAISTGFFDGETSGHWSEFSDGGQKVIDGKITPFGWYVAFRDLAGATGAAEGFAIWFLACHRVPSPPQS